MTLTLFLKALKSKNVLVSILDKDEKEICKIYSDGVDALSDELEAMVVTRWEITSSTAIEVSVDEA